MTTLKFFCLFKGLMTDRTIMNSSFFKKFQHWREVIIPFDVENFSMLPNAEKEKISNMHHVFCGFSYIALVHMRKKQFLSGKRLSRSKGTCMEVSKLHKCPRPTICFLRFQSF